MAGPGAVAPPDPTAKREFPYWLLAAGMLAVAFALVIAASDQYQVIFRAILRGVWTTTWVTFVAFGLASALGLFVALGRLSRHRVIREVATFYVEIVRGIPVLVLLFYMAFVGAPAFVAGVNWLLSPLVERGWTDGMHVRDFSLVWRAIAALTISYSAYIAEVFRAGIEAVDRGQTEAAKSLGLNRWHTFRLIVWPQALRTILPPLGNDFVAMIKDSALVSALGVQDITQMGKVYSSSTFLFFETYNVVAYIYLLMTVSLSLLVRGLERRLKRSAAGDRR